ncbi:MAG: HD domain-containing protein [Bacillota bacterium]|nr:HD domain-containing protein [Bacillota bacterium]
MLMKYARVCAIIYVLALSVAILFFNRYLKSYDSILLYLSTFVLLVMAVLEILTLKRYLKVKDKAAGFEDDETDSSIKTDELQVIRELSEVITSTFDINTIIEYIYKIFNRFTDCDRCLINILDKGKNELICKYEFGEKSLDITGCTFGENSMITSCFNEKKTKLRTNILIQSRNIYGDKLAMPLNVTGETIGVIFMEGGKPGAFEKANINFLESLAIYTAISIKNSELFNNVYLQKQEIEALYEQAASVNEELNNSIQEVSVTKEELKEKNEELVSYFDEIQTGYLQTVMALANSIEAKDSYTRGHCQRVMEVACEIAQKLGCNEEEIEILRYSAILHDIGKIGIHAYILNKEGKLTGDEYEEIKRHPLIAYNILKEIRFLKSGLEAILQHHERYDGTGYPFGLTGDNIGRLGKILCIADAYDAMTSDRPYRKSLKLEEAVSEIERCKGTQFDPEIADIFIRMNREILGNN